MVRRFVIAIVALFLVVGHVTAAPSQQPDSSPQGNYQDQGYDPPAHVSFVEGVATLEREGRIDDTPANMPLLAGDRLRTRAGRLEILFADGSTLHLDANSTVDLQSDELVRLIDGRIRLSIPGPARSLAYRIDTPFAWVQITEPGEYRTAVLTNSARSEVEVAVLRGAAELLNEDGRTPLRAGERAYARAAAAPSYAYVFNSGSWDAFDRWSEARRSERMGLSTQYLPEEVQSYAGTLDRHGSWRNESSYGYVWYPRVDAGWRPYYQGRWSTVRPYGWTWIGSDPWAWPTHHYGRWGFSGGVWFWIPGRTWAPAWVSWAYAPGYVSWCPLGWNNRPVFQIVNINIHRGYDPWRAWTIVPQRHFGSGFVHRRGVGGYDIDQRTRSSFAYRDRAPVTTGYAVPRGSAGAAPIRVAGTGPARRGAPATVLTNRGSGAESYRPSTPSTDRGNAADRPSSTARERTVPDRPMVRSERGDAARARSAAGDDGARPTDTRQPSYSSRPDSTARPREFPGTQRNDRTNPPQPGLERPERAEPETSTRPTYSAPERRAVPRPEYGRSPQEYRAPQDDRGASREYRPPQDSRPSPRGDRPAAGAGGGDRPASGPGYSAPERRTAPAAARPAPSAQPPAPSRGGPPPSAAPPSGSRPRGGGAESRGTATRRPGGGTE